MHVGDNYMAQAFAPEAKPEFRAAWQAHHVGVLLKPKSCSA